MPGTVARTEFWYDAAVNSDDAAPILTPAHAAFLPHRTSMNVAVCDGQNRPSLARGLGIRVSGDRRLVSVFLSQTHATQVLRCLGEGSAIALAVTRPTTHETLQLKGKVVQIAPMSADDLSALASYQDSVVEEIVSLGYQTEFVRSLLSGSEDCLAVVFQPTELFNQTPGPRAGEKLEIST